ncbi:Ubiquitin carboxyl-terminal hydrolase [Balamuthia mandrillaris]
MEQKHSRQENNATMGEGGKVNVDELLASSASLLPRRLAFHKAKRVDSLQTLRSTYAPLNPSYGQGARQQHRSRGGGHDDAEGEDLATFLERHKQSSGANNSSKTLGKKSKTKSSQRLEEAEGPNPEYSLCPKPKVWELLEWKQVRKLGPGLHNLGNTCFLNSVLQCLTYTPPLANYCLQRSHSKTCRRVGFCAFCTMEGHIAKALKTPGGAFAPKPIVANLRAIVRHFRLGRQEDAHEFLRYLVESLHKASLPKLPEQQDKAKMMLIQQTSLVHRIFGGYLQSQVTCAACSFNSNTFDPFLDLSLEIRQNKCNSLADAFAHFTKRETLDTANLYKCESCNKRSRATKQFTIFEAPSVLTVQLKRFAFSGMFGGKINKYIQFPRRLCLKPFMSANQSDKNPIYTLYGVLVHSGYDTRAGHYYCFIKNSNGIWYEMNDSSCSQVSEQAVLKQQAYMLFYVREPSSLPETHSSSGSEESESEKEVYNNHSNGSSSHPSSTTTSPNTTPKTSKLQSKNNTAASSSPVSPSPLSSSTTMSSLTNRHMTHTKPTDNHNPKKRKREQRHSLPTDLSDEKQETQKEPAGGAAPTTPTKPSPILLFSSNGNSPKSPSIATSPQSGATSSNSVPTTPASTAPNSNVESSGGAMSKRQRRNKRRQENEEQRRLSLGSQTTDSTNEDLGQKISRSSIITGSQTSSTSSPSTPSSSSSIPVTNTSQPPSTPTNATLQINGSESPAMVTIPTNKTSNTRSVDQLGEQGLGLFGASKWASGSFFGSTATLASRTPILLFGSNTKVSGTTSSTTITPSVNGHSSSSSSSSSSLLSSSASAPVTPIKPTKQGQQHTPAQNGNHAARNTTPAKKQTKKNAKLNINGHANGTVTDDDRKKKQKETTANKEEHKPATAITEPVDKKSKEEDAERPTIISFDDTVYRTGKVRERLSSNGSAGAVAGGNTSKGSAANGGSPHHTNNGSVAWKKLLRQLNKKTTTETALGVPVSGWDDDAEEDGTTQSKQAQQLVREQALQAIDTPKKRKYTRDEWDVEYDKGKVKKVRSKKDFDEEGGDGKKKENVFQAFQNQGQRSPHQFAGKRTGKGAKGRGGGGGGKRGGGRGGGRGRGGKFNKARGGGGRRASHS